MEVSPVCRLPRERRASSRRLKRDLLIYFVLSFLFPLLFSFLFPLLFSFLFPFFFSCFLFLFLFLVSFFLLFLPSFLLSFYLFYRERGVLGAWIDGNEELCASPRLGSVCLFVYQPSARKEADPNVPSSSYACCSHYFTECLFIIKSQVAEK